VIPVIVPPGLYGVRERSVLVVLASIEVPKKSLQRRSVLFRVSGLSVSRLVSDNPNTSTSISRRLLRISQKSKRSRW
jgi:hypothetical protein